MLVGGAKLADERSSPPRGEKTPSFTNERASFSMATSQRKSEAKRTDIEAPVVTTHHPQ